MVDIKDSLEKRILILDGAMGTLIQSYGLNEQVFRGERFAGWNVSLSGNNEVLNLTAQEVVEDIHRRYIRAGADIITTNFRRSAHCPTNSRQPHLPHLGSRFHGADVQVIVFGFRHESAGIAYCQL